MSLTNENESLRTEINEQISRNKNLNNENLSLVEKYFKLIFNAFYLLSKTNNKYINIDSKEPKNKCLRWNVVITF